MDIVFCSGEARVLSMTCVATVFLCDSRRDDATEHLCSAAFGVLLYLPALCFCGRYTSTPHSAVVHTASMYAVGMQLDA